MGSLCALAIGGGDPRWSANMLTTEEGMEGKTYLCVTKILKAEMK